MTSIPRGGFRLLAATATVTLLLAAGAGCAQQSPGGGGHSGSGSTAHPAPTQDTTGDIPVDEEPRTDLADEEVVQWRNYEVVSDRQLRFHFPTGTPDCFGARTAVEEDGEAIRVATVVGILPEAPKDCAAVGRTASILVTTDAPIGDRAVEHLEVAGEDLS